MLQFLSKHMSKGKTGRHSRRGAVAVMALLVAMVTAVLFQAYMSHVLSDMQTGQTFDTYAQYQGERVAIGQMLKESIIEYYEGNRLGNTPADIKTSLDAYLTTMTGISGVTYTVTVEPTMPTNTVASFWPNLSGKNAAGTAIAAGSVGEVTTLNGDFQLISEALPASLSYGRMAQYMPDTSAVLSIKDTNNPTDPEVFTYTVTRTQDGETVTFTFYVRMYQAPVTDFNLISYAIVDQVADIPATPPALPTAMATSIADGDIDGVCFSQMAGNSIALTTSYPYAFRELFSSASSLWEYVFYKHNGQSYLPVSGLFSNTKGVYVMSDVTVSGDVSLLDTSVTPSTCVVQAAMDNSTGFDPDYRTGANFTGNMVDANGYRVDANGNYLYNSKGVQYLGVTIDTDNDGIIDSGETTVATAVTYGIAPAVTAPQSVIWTFDLNKIKTPTASTDLIRRIYVTLPQTTAPASQIVIRDSDTASPKTAKNPVVICIEGWSRADDFLASAAGVPANYKLYLDGDLTAQQIMIYAVGVDVTTYSVASSINGLIMLDDKLASLDAGVGMTINGLLVWNGDQSAAVPLTNVTVNKLAAVSAFRAAAPRFLLVDVKSKTN